MKNGFDVILGRNETSAGKAFGSLRQTFDHDVLVEASVAFSRKAGGYDPGWQIVMNTRLSLPGKADDSKKSWHDVSCSSSVGMFGVMMRRPLTFPSLMRRILPPVPLDE